MDISIDEYAEMSKRAYEYSLVHSQENYAKIIEKGYSAEYGARPLKRYIEQNIEDELAERILAGEFGENSIVTVGFKDGHFVFNANDN